MGLCPTCRWGCACHRYRWCDCCGRRYLASHGHWCVPANPWYPEPSLGEFIRAL